jgi:phage-related protein
MNAFPNIQPSQSTQLQKNYNTLFTQFGGAYAQIAPNGVNWQVPTWNLEFDNLNATDSATLEAFLDANAGSLFTWTPPSGNGSVWFLNQTVSSQGFAKTNNGLVNTYQFSLTAIY